MAFLKKVEAKYLSFDDIPGSMAYLDRLSPGDLAAKCAVNIALWDGAGKRKKTAIYDILGLGFREEAHVTSYTIGIDTPEMVKVKVAEAAQ